jgi:hypothetical protein
VTDGIYTGFIGNISKRGSFQKDAGIRQWLAMLSDFSGDCARLGQGLKVTDNNKSSKNIYIKL